MECSANKAYKQIVRAPGTREGGLYPPNKIVDFQHPVTPPPEPHLHKQLTPWPNVIEKEPAFCNKTIDSSQRGRKENGMVEKSPDCGQL